MKELQGVINHNDMERFKAWCKHRKKKEKRTDVKTCLQCLKNKPNGEFYAYKSGTLRPICKQCEIDNERNRYLQKKLKLFPNLYVKCYRWNCSNIWKKSLSDKCPKCGG